MRTPIAVLLLIYSSLNAQHTVLSAALTNSARALGNTGICDWNPVSGLMNPALLAVMDHNNISLEAHNYFFTAGINTFSVQSTFLVNKKSGFELNVISDGSVDLREWLFCMSYGKKLHSNTEIGMRIDFLQTQTPESKNLHNIGFELGLQTKPIPTLLIGFIIKNPIPIQAAGLYPYPSVFKFGINYKLDESFQTLVEIHKEGTQSPSLHFGINYIPVNSLVFRSGLNTTGPSLSMGCSIQFKKNLAITTAFENHAILGLSSSVGFNYLYD